MRWRMRSSCSISSTERIDSLRAMALRILRQGDVLELADALAGDVESLADLLERQLVLAVEAEAQPDDLGLALVERVDHRVQVGVEILSRRALDRG